MVKLTGTWQRGLAFGILLLAILGVICFGCVDTRLIQWVNRHKSAWANPFWIVSGFRQLGKAWGPIWLTLFWLTRSKKYEVACTALLSLLLSTLTVWPLKGLCLRPRPYAVLETQFMDSTQAFSHHNFSFPSGDTATAFCFAGAIAAALSRSWPWILFMTAGLIGALRIMDLAHYPSDVCAGAAIGLASVWTARWLVKRWRWDFSKRRGVPKLIWMGVVLLPLLWLIESRDAPIHFFSLMGPIALGLAWHDSRINRAETCVADIA